MKKAFIVLENGTVFEGMRIGAETDSIGELIFTTGVCGYIETLTDPGYEGQIVVQTFPLIGNYGMIEEDAESDHCTVKGYIVRELCEEPSNFRAQYQLDAYLKAQGIPGICGVDTRELTAILRENGVMNGKICSEIPADLKEIKAYKVIPQVSEGKVPALYPAKGEKKCRVALLDFGAAKSFLERLQENGYEVTVVSKTIKAEELLSMDIDGVILSNGAGDPADYADSIEQIKTLFGKLPLFGVGLGHQLMAIAKGSSAEKMKVGHRSGNQPVKDLNGTRTYITTQNHGYQVTQPVSGKPSFQNVNDGSCEGFEYPEEKAFSVQFMLDDATEFLLERFLSMMGGK